MKFNISKLFKKRVVENNNVVFIEDGKLSKGKLFGNSFSQGFTLQSKVHIIKQDGTVVDIESHKFQKDDGTVL